MSLQNLVNDAASQQEKVSNTANTGILAGLITTFLPLAQVFPHTVPASTVHECVVAGITLIVTSILGKLFHHGYVSTHTPQIASTVATDVAPPIEARLSNLETSFANLEKRLGQ